MKADTVNLVAVFGTDRHHVIPLFQRPYVWSQEDNWEPLWADVKAAAEEVEGEQQGGRIPVDRVSRTHFLGAVVLERGPVAPGRVPSLSVIDGQQRLTTLQVLIAASWANAKAHNALNAEALLRLLLNNTEQLIRTEQPQERYKVWPSQPDREAFRAVQVQTLPARGREEHLLIQARRYFTDEIDSWLNESSDPAARVDALVIALRERLGLVEIQLEEHDDAQVIFETLNDRGTRLQAADLVKNTLFRLAEQQGEDVYALYEQHWQPLEAPRWRADVTTGRIKRARIDLLLSYWLSIHTGSEVPVERLFADFRIWLKQTDLRAAEILADLAHHGRALQRMDNLQATTATGRLLQVLDLLKTSTPIPVLLHLHAREGVTDDQRSKAASAIESFLVRRMVCNLTTKDYNRLFLTILQTARKTSDEAAGERLVSLLAAQTATSRYWPDDTEFVMGVVSDGIDRLLRGPRLRVLLGGLETALRQDKSELHFAPAQVEKLSVEHLLPQKWSQYYPLPTDVEPQQAEERRTRAVHKIGNLTLTTTKLNSSISNGSWPTKKKELNKHAVLLLTASSVLQAPQGVSGDISYAWPDNWDEQRVDLRTLFMAKIAAEAWPRPEPDAAFLASDQEREPRPNPLDGSPSSQRITVSDSNGKRGDIGAHVIAAFEGLDVGTFLTIAQIALSPSDAYTNSAPSQGAIAARLFPSSGRCTVEGVQPSTDESGRRGAVKAAASRGEHP